MSNTIYMNSESMELEELNDTISGNDPVTIVVSDQLENASVQTRVLDDLGHYLHDNLEVPFGQIIVLIGQSAGNKSFLKTCHPEKVTGTYLAENCMVTEHNRETRLFTIGKSRQGSDMRVNPMVIGRKVISLGDSLQTITNAKGECFQELEKLISPACNIAI